MEFCCFGEDYEDEDEDEVYASPLSLFSREDDHMPSANYLTSLKEGAFVESIRQDAIDYISKVNRLGDWSSRSSSDLDPALSCLAVNYLDRFLSSQRFERAKPWVSKLLSVSCLSLAAKMLGADLPVSAIKGEGGSVHDSRTVHRMEFLILGALGWRMRSVTPFSFLPFFASLFELKDVPSRQALRARAIEIIIKALADIRLSRFKPSVVAASALLSASHDLFPIQFHNFRSAIYGCSHIHEEEFIDCCRATQEATTERYESSVSVDDISVSDTPQNVLDQQFSTASPSSTSSSSADDHGSVTEPTPKRRKTDD